MSRDERARSDLAAPVADQDLAAGRAAADAAGRRRAGAGRHGAGGGRDASLRVGAFIAALLGAVFIQVGANLSNDYSDARRGADTEDRLGPVRVTAGGLVPPEQVLTATYVSFALAVLCGVYLIIVAGWVILAIGAASILAGVLYTGGPRPYGYEGLGDVFVFLFFGLVAVTGSYYAQVEQLEWEAFALAVPVGLIAAAILAVNNIRDAPTDARVGKRTLAVRLGRGRARDFYAAEVYVAFLIPLAVWLAGGAHVGPWVLLTWLALPLAVPLVRTVRQHDDGPTLNGALAQDGDAAAGVLRVVERGVVVELGRAVRGCSRCGLRGGPAGAQRALVVVRSVVRGHRGERAELAARARLSSAGAGGAGGPGRNVCRVRLRPAPATTRHRPRSVAGRIGRSPVRPRSSTRPAARRPGRSNALEPRESGDSDLRGPSRGGRPAPRATRILPDARPTARSRTLPRSAALNRADGLAPRPARRGGRPRRPRAET